MRLLNAAPAKPTTHVVDITSNYSYGRRLVLVRRRQRLIAAIRGGFPSDQVEVDGRRPGQNAAGVEQRLTYPVLVFRSRNHDECGRRFIHM